MALLDRRLKQRIVGAAVLLALVVVFLPMLFQRQDEQRPVQVEAPPMPAIPPVMPLPAEPVVVPEPQVAAMPVESAESADSAVEDAAPTVAGAPSDQPAVQALQQPTPVQAAESQATPVGTGRLDVEGLPLSWTVQLASLSSRARAEELQGRLRKQGYNAYIRSVEGMSRVFVGPLIERGEAERVSAQIARQYKLSPIVVRFQPESR